MSLNNLISVYERTISGDELKYEGNINNVDYYSLIFKSAAKNLLYNCDSETFCMFKYHNIGKDYVLILFSLPINSEKNTKALNERVTNVIDRLEKTFIEIERIKIDEMSDEKFLYILAVKQVDIDY